MRAVLMFMVLVLAVTLRFDEAPDGEEGPARRAERRFSGRTGHPRAAASGSTPSSCCCRSADDRLGEQARPVPGRGGALTTALSWALVHLLFALEYAKLSTTRPAAPTVRRAGGLDFPGGHPPNYVDFLYFSFVIGVACQTAEVATLTRSMRRIVLAQGLIAFVFNTVILAATINVAAGWSRPA